MDSIFIREATADDLEVILHHRVAMFYDMGLTDPSALQAKQAAAAPYYTQDSAKALITDGWPSMHGAEWWAAAASDSSPGRRTRNIPSRTAPRSSTSIPNWNAADVAWPAAWCR